MSKKSFTLIELLVVVAIIGLLASIILVSLQGARAKARDTRRIAELDTLSKALAFYYDDHEIYPIGSDVLGCIEEGSAYDVLKSTLIDKGYLGILPKDPKYNSSACFWGTEPFSKGCFCYFYETREEGQFYRIAAKLEKGSTLTITDGGTEDDMYEIMSTIGLPLGYPLPPLYTNWAGVDTTKSDIQWFRGEDIFPKGKYEVRSTEWYTYWSATPSTTLCATISFSDNEYVCSDAGPHKEIEGSDAWTTENGTCHIYAWCPGEHGCWGATQYTVSTTTDTTFDENYYINHGFTSSTLPLPHGPYLVLETLPKEISEYFTVNENDYYFAKLKRFMTNENYNNLVATGVFEITEDSKIGYHFSDCAYGDNSQQMHSEIALKKIE